MSPPDGGRTPAAKGKSEDDSRKEQDPQKQQEQQKEDDQRKEQEQATGRGIAVRAMVFAIGLALVVLILVDWNAIRFEGGMADTIDAQLRGNPVRIEAHVAGLVTRVPIDDDQLVHRGQVLYEIEQDTYRAQAAQARAQAAQAAAELAEFGARIAAQRASVARAVADAQANAANLLRARRELARQDALHGTEGGNLRDWQQAVADTRQYSATQAADEDAIRQSEAQIAILRARQDQAAATLATAQAQARYAEITLGYTRIVAPADGRVTARLAFPGEFVTPGRPLITFIVPGDVWAESNYREEQLIDVRVGQRAEIHVDAYPGVTLHGHVASIGPASQAQSSPLPPERATGNFTKVVQRIPVRITLDPDVPAGLRDRLLPGLSVETHIITGGG